jgi:hypothetical protein
LSKGVGGDAAMELDDYDVFIGQYHVIDRPVNELVLCRYSDLNIHFDEKKISLSGARAFTLLYRDGRLYVNFTPQYRTCDFHQHGKPYGLYRAHDGTLFKKYKNLYKDEERMKECDFIDTRRYNDVLNDKIRRKILQYQHVKDPVACQQELNLIRRWYLTGYYDMLDRMKRHVEFLTKYYAKYKSSDYLLTGDGLKFLTSMTLEKSPRLHFTDDTSGEHKIVKAKEKLLSPRSLDNSVKIVQY